jgi:hypothetical protein
MLGKWVVKEDGIISSVCQQLRLQWKFPGVWQEGREGEERLMSAIMKPRKTGVGECYLETRGGSPCPRS